MTDPVDEDAACCIDSLNEKKLVDQDKDGVKVPKTEDTLFTDVWSLIRVSLSDPTKVETSKEFGDVVVF